MNLKPVDNSSVKIPKVHCETPKGSLWSEPQRNYPTEPLNYVVTQVHREVHTRGKTLPHSLRSLALEDDE